MKSCNTLKSVSNFILELTDLHEFNLILNYIIPYHHSSSPHNLLNFILAHMCLIFWSSLVQYSTRKLDTLHGRRFPDFYKFGIILPVLIMQIASFPNFQEMLK